MLHRVFRGTFAVGHPAVGRLGEMQAAVLACKCHAFISHGSAAELLQLTDRHQALIHLIGDSEAGRGIQDVRWHRHARLRADEVTVVKGIPCTAGARTLVDLAGVVGQRSLRGMVEEAAVQRSLDVGAIDRILSRGRRRGAPRLRALLAPWRAGGEDDALLRSRLEARLWAESADRGLARPRSNAIVELDGNRLEVDFVWDEARLVVEMDGAATHGTPTAFRRDRWRDQLLVAAGYRVIRVTWDQMRDEPDAVIARITQALQGRS
jgi:very-short-patch-repair endonuclease